MSDTTEEPTSPDAEDTEATPTPTTSLGALFPVDPEGVTPGDVEEADPDETRAAKSEAQREQEEQQRRQAK